MNTGTVSKQMINIDEDRLRELIYNLETTIQSALDTLSPLHKDLTLKKIDLDLTMAMGDILDIREMLAGE